MARAAGNRADRGRNREARRRLERLIERATQPLWRTMHAHAFEQTDLEVFKIDRTADRVALLVEGQRVCICALYLDHNEYESNLPTLRRANFAPERFQLWRKPTA